MRKECHAKFLSSYLFSCGDISFTTVEEHKEHRKNLNKHFVILYIYSEPKMFQYGFNSLGAFDTEKRDICPKCKEAILSDEETEILKSCHRLGGKQGMIHCLQAIGFEYLGEQIYKD